MLKHALIAAIFFLHATFWVQLTKTRKPLAYKKDSSCNFSFAT